LARENRLVGEARPGRQRAGYDLIAQALGDLLVLLDGYAATPAATPARYSTTSSAVVTSA